MTSVPEFRIRPGNEEGLNREGSFVLYWMTAFRRLGWNFALQHAADLARTLGKPLAILESLWVDYPFASHRLHRFILEGMAERSETLRSGSVTHYPYVERAPNEGQGLLPALSEAACCVVTDDFPSFFLPEMAATTGSRLRVRLELVDSNGLLPIRSTDRVFKAAYHFRRHLQKELPEHLPELPDPDPLAEDLPPGAHGVEDSILERWPPASGPLLRGDEEALAALPLDSSIPPVPAAGRYEEARRRLEVFSGDRLEAYADDRNHPDAEATSELSPYLHFGIISSHEVFAEIVEREEWTPLRLSEDTSGSRSGWWGMSAGAEAFLDQLVTWRELGFNMSGLRDDVTRYESLPEWARDTLEEHAEDPRPYLYDYEEFREAGTHDPLWNAAQTQLLTEGVIHNYLRMLWGKKILHWSAHPREALEVMLDLNDRFALDGRDPNSYSGIFWCLGRYDRGWPEREVFGKVRSMTSRSTKRKVNIDQYMDRFSSERE